MVGTDLDAFAVLVVHNADFLARNDERVSCAEAIRHERREIDALLHRHHRVLALVTELTDQFHHKLAVCLSALFHLSVIGSEVLGRIAYPLPQSLAKFVLTERMCVRTLCGILARRVGFLRIEPCRRRTGNPSCGRGCGENGMLTCQCAQPPSRVPHTAPVRCR